MTEPTFSPYRYAKGAQVMRSRSGDGYKTRAHRLAEALGMRYVGRAGGYVGTSTQCDRLARLHAAGWDAHTLLFSGSTLPFSGDPGTLPEPFMRRHPGLWIAPKQPAVSDPTLDALRQLCASRLDDCLSVRREVRSWGADRLMADRWRGSLRANRAVLRQLNAARHEHERAKGLR